MVVLKTRVPAPAFLVVSAVFHYLGPAFAVLLFGRVAPLGVAWLRIASAAAVFAVWRRPWRAPHLQLRLLVAFGLLLAAMNCAFYLAIARLPLATVGAIEFLGVIALAATGARTVRNALAVLLAVAGVFVLTDVRLGGQPLGFAFAFANCALFMGYVALGHRVANTEPGSSRYAVDQLAAAMGIACLAATPVGFAAAAPAFTHASWLLAGIAVGVCSSVIPYVTDQLAMARMSRATFALMLSILPAVATLTGLLVLTQRPTVPDLLGIALVSAAVAAHQPAEA